MGTLYEEVSKYCSDAGITIHEFERRCKLGNGTVGKWRKAATYPSSRTILKIVAGTGVPFEKWLGESVWS